MEPINVLVIEDKKGDLVSLEKILKASGYKVWSASRGGEGIKLAKSVSFAAVITELHMPRMNGIDITRALLRVNPQISIVVITAYTFISSAIEAMQEGAYGYVTKPFNSSEIRIVLERAVERFYLLSSDKKKERFAELSVKDSLTGVYNRRFLKMYVANRISLVERTTERFSLLMADIDYFKKYNDTKGHLAGDQLLKRMCEVFRESIRQEDVIFRYGGEEFIIFLAHTDKEGAILVAERIRTVVNLYMPTTVSIGVGTFPDDGAEFEKLVAKVDKALYKAKESGRNKVCIV
ncbi:MAG: diguanylate cyclase [Candidatus Omnitrophota bacterium]|nr:MAG: diguanylate cyclase [Candidatus Omnitrophota bacterium]